MSCQRKNDIRGTDMNEGKHLGELSMNMNDHGNTHAKVNKSHNVLLPLNNSSSQLSCSPGGLSSSGALGLVSLTHPASCFPWDQSVSRWPPPMAQGPGASSQFFPPVFSDQNYNICFTNSIRSGLLTPSVTKSRISANWTVQNCRSGAWLLITS